MRELFPTNSKTPTSINPSSGSVFTEEQYEQLLSQIDELREELAADKIDLDTFKHNLEQAVTTITVTSENIRTNILNATTAVLTHLTATDITAPDASISRLIADAITGDTAALRVLTASEVTSENATISNLNATEATIGELHTTTFNPASVSTTDLTATNATITNETVDKSTVNDATITNADINKAEVVELKADEADILEAEINQIYAKNLNVKYITHKELYNRQEVTTASTSADGDYWIILPKFLNGSFNILAKSDTNEILWSMEVMNSTRNIAFRWSVNDDYNYLKDVDLVLDAESCQEFIQIHANTNGLATFLYYRADSYDTEVTPTIWAVNQYYTTDPLKHFDFNRAAGTWLPNSVFAGEFHADSMIIDETVFEKITLNHDLNLPTAYDQYGNPINYTAGTPGQYVTPTVDEYDHTGIQWKEPVDNRTPSEVDETRTLITEATLGNYTGEMTAERIPEAITEYADILTDATQCYKVVDNFYPITDKRQVAAFREEYDAASLTQEEAEALIASGLYYNDGTDYIQITSINVEDKIINGDDYSADWDTLKLYGNEVPAHDQIYFKGGWTTVEYPFDVWVANGIEYNIVHTGDGTVVHGDATINNDLDVKRDAHIERDAVVDKDTSIGGDLTVATVWTDPEDSSITKENKVRLPNIYNGPASQEPNNMPDDSLIISNGSHTETTTTTVYTDGTNFYDEDGTATTEPSGTAGTPSVIGDFVLDSTTWYQKVSDTWYEVDDFIDNTNWTEVTDSELIAILDAATTVEVSSVVYTESTTVNDGAKLMRKSSFAIGGVVTAKKDEIAARNSDYSEVVDGETVHWDDMDAKPLVWNKDRNAIQPTNTLDIGDVSFDDLTVRGKATVAETLDVTGTTRIGGDLYVSGTSHIVDEEHISTTGDLVTLRQNAVTGLLPGQVSGLIINNYKEDDQHNPVDMALVTDETGTLRVGTGSGISTDYTKIAWKEADAKWYSYDDTDPDDIQYTLMSPQPSGTVTDYTGKTEKDPYTLYATATFTVIDKTTLEPILTRDEEANLTDQAILKWDADGTKAKTLPLPTINGQKLVGTITVDDTDPLNPVTTYDYEWGGTSDPSVFRFATVEAYETALLIPEGQTGYIPDGSIILIDGNYNMEMGV